MNDASTSNSVKLAPEGFIDIALVGDQTYQSIEDVGKQSIKLAEQLHAQGKPVWGLVNFSQERGFNTGSNKAAMEVLAKIAYDRVAIFGDNKVLAEVADLIVKALGKSDNTKVFATREEAVAWLVMKDLLRG